VTEEEAPDAVLANENLKDKRGRDTRPRPR
jgi:hypothetical protein